MPCQLPAPEVHAAYWNLYGTYVNLYVDDQGSARRTRPGRSARNLLKEGKIDNSHYSQILAQYEQFRGDRMRALASVLDAERNLRVLIGIFVDDGLRLVPDDSGDTILNS